MTFSRVLATAAITAMAGTGLAQAESHVDPAIAAAIKARQSHMSLYAFNLSVLGGMARGNTEYNADLAKAAASDLAKLATLTQMSYWPEGSSSEDVEGTAALPAAWENFDDIMGKAGALAEAAASLEAVAGDGLEALQAGFGPVGGACGTCHKAYRVPDE